MAKTGRVRTINSIGVGGSIPPPGPEREALAKKIVDMHDNDEMAYHDIAVKLDIPYGSISRLVKKYRLENP